MAIKKVAGDELLHTWALAEGLLRKEGLQRIECDNGEELFFYGNKIESVSAPFANDEGLISGLVTVDLWLTSRAHLVLVVEARQGENSKRIALSPSVQELCSPWAFREPGAAYQVAGGLVAELAAKMTARCPFFRARPINYVE